MIARHSAGVLQKTLALSLSLSLWLSADALASCGFVIGAFGQETGRSMVAAIYTVQRLVRMSPSVGWCPLERSLSHYPITFYTDLEPSRLTGLGLDAADTRGLSIVHPREAFEPVDVPSASKVGSHIGAPLYRWYHCQMMLHAPYELVLYMDADATVCREGLVDPLFATLAGNADVIFKTRFAWLPAAGSGGGAGLLETRKDLCGHPKCCMLSERSQ